MPAPGPGATPTLNQLLQSPTPDGWHPSSEYGMTSQQRMMSDESGAAGYGPNQPGWQRMGQGTGPYPPQHQMGMQQAGTGGFDRRPGSGPGGGGGIYGPQGTVQQGPAGLVGSPPPPSHQVQPGASSQSQPGYQQFSPANHSTVLQQTSSPTTTPQHKESGSSLPQSAQQPQHSSPQQLPTKSHHSSKHKTKKQQQQQQSSSQKQQQQQQHGNDEAPAEGNTSSASAASRHITPGPNVQHPTASLPPAPSPGVSGGSRSGTPASSIAGSSPILQMLHRLWA
jgi:hypothetical protein